jgi:non-lysosomal glucosylceramidase
VLSSPHTRKALESLWRYNFTPDVGPFRKNSKIQGGRWYAMPGEGGLVMCSFPDPEHPKPLGDSWSAMYFNECMSGFEHQVASHMVWEGGDLVEKGLAVSRMIHDRYHASRRNPWNEVECGDHYGRALAGYSVFTGVCGYEYNGPKGYLAFAPRLTPEHFRAPFTAAEGWGTYSQKTEGGKQNMEIELKWGRLRLNTLSIVPDATLLLPRATVTLGGQRLEAKLTMDKGRAVVTFADEAIVSAGGKLELTLG